MVPRIIRRQSPIHGNGVFAARVLPAETVLVEYRGRLRTHAQALHLYGDSADSGHTFLFTLNDTHVIDANFDGNLARWINHSCDPNCEAVGDELVINGSLRERVIIQSLRPIAVGEEITIDYGIVLEERHTARMKRIWACLCRSEECTGTLLRPKRGRPRSAAADANSECQSLRD